MHSESNGRLRPQHRSCRVASCCVASCGRPLRHVLATLTLALGALPHTAHSQASPTGAEQPAATVSGRVLDSLTNTPLVNALVAVRPAGLTTTTDDDGRFAFHTAQPAREITVYHPTLDELGLGALVASRDAGAATSAWTNVTLAIPSQATLWSRLCHDEVATPGHDAVVMGTARLADNRTRVAGAKVLLQWMSALAADSGGVRTVEAPTDSIGNYVACGVPAFLEVTVVALSQQAQSGLVRLAGSVQPIRRVDLVLGERGAATGTARVAGRIVDSTGAALTSIRVSIDGLATEVQTDADGGFVLDNVPLGSRMLQLRGIGYRPVAQVVEVLAAGIPELVIPLSTAVELAEVRTTARISKRPYRRDFEMRRRAGFAQFVDSTQIMSVPILRNALQMVPNVRVQAVKNSPTTGFEILGRNGCSAHIYLDGMLSNLGEVNDIPRENLAAVEFYSSVAFAPAQFIRVMADSCAVAAFWTKWALRP